MAVVVQTLESDALGAKAREPVMLVFDQSQFALELVYTFTLGHDVHSACMVGDTIYAVSTGTDEVIAVPWHGNEFGPERVVWSPEPDGPREDIHHLNAVLYLDGDVLVSGFGAKAGARWASAHQGFIYNVTSGEMVLQGIDQPHSLFDLDGKIGYCESRRSTVRVVGDSRSLILPGYSRGTARVGEHLFVATSVGRSTSANNESTVDNPAVGGVPAGRCTVSLLSVRDFRVEQTIEIAPAASEIYDLLAVEDAGGWPTSSEFGCATTPSAGLPPRLKIETPASGV